MQTEKPTKARTKGQRRARKRDLRDNPMALPQIPRREKDGRAHRTTAERDAVHETLLARCRRAAMRTCSRISATCARHGGVAKRVA